LTGPRVRVLVVEDSATVRERLCVALASHPGFELVGEAADGPTAIALCRSLRPDVVTLDLILPGMSGLAVTEFVMAWCPTPILVVSAATNRGEVVQTMDALQAGAVDVLEKPTGDEPAGAWEATFLSSVRMVARIKVITHPRARLGLRNTREPPPSEPSSADPARRVVAIGASTGGPAAVLHVLRDLGAGFPLPILVVIHIGAVFAPGLVAWLDTNAPMPVLIAVDGTPLEQLRGRAVLAPADAHLTVERGRVRLSDAPERHSCRPSVDVLFASLAVDDGPGTVACLLTGMGRDGAEGLLAVRHGGGATIAQDEATSVVFGMPREAILRSAAELVLPLDRIGGAVSGLVARRRMR
jgi:two-component system chemotaxis response regulator CheB